MAKITFWALIAVSREDERETQTLELYGKIIEWIRRKLSLFLFIYLFPVYLKTLFSN
jgi:hypothetical protein